MSLKQTLRLTHPLIIAPMAGGPTTPDLVAAGCRAGATGFIGAAYMKPEAILEACTLVRAKTDRAFGVNLFVTHDTPSVSAPEFEAALIATLEFRRELGLDRPALAPPYEEDFEAQFAAVLQARPAALSFVFGILPAEKIRAAQVAGILVFGGATTLAEALAVEKAGVDAIVLQGIEAGGHRAILDPRATDEEVPLLELLKACRSQLKIPLIAAGGIMNRGHVKRALAAGAELVQMGTAFLDCREAGTSAPYRTRLREARVTETTRAFSGRLARGIVNRFMREMKGRPLLPFPAQNKFTRDLRAAASIQGSSEFLSLWSGTGAGPLWTGSAEDLIKSLFQ